MIKLIAEKGIFTIEYLKRDVSHIPIGIDANIQLNDRIIQAPIIGGLLYRNAIGEECIRFNIGIEP